MNRGRINLGILLIIIGGLFLLESMGLLDRAVWWKLQDYWPVLLILFGLYVAFGRTRLWFIPALSLVVAVVALFTATPSPGGLAFQDERAVGVDIQSGTRQAALSLVMGAGELRIAGPTSGLYAGTLRPGGPITVETLQRNGRATVDVRQQGRDLWFLRSPLRQEWELLLNRDIPWELDLTAGAGVMTLDLTQILVRSLDVRGGAGQLTAAFGPQSAGAVVRIKAGAGDVELDIPRDVQARVHFTGVATGNNLRQAGLIQEGEAWVTPGYAQAEERMHISVSLAAGRLELRRDR